MKKRPIIDVAYDLLKGKGESMAFPLLWDLVCSEEGLNAMQREELIADFYTDLSVDARFVNLGKNNWDLREHHLFKEVFIDTDSILVDDSSEEVEFEFEEEKKETKEEEF
ncbi:MAG: DNA-directed RNA polymerase subunit delta [Erysipelotrichaceae bacterium]